MEPTCLNLRKRFGADYRISYDPSYDYRGVHVKDPWMMQLPCRGGITIYPYGGDRLAVEIDGHPYLASAVAAVPGLTLHQQGHREKTYLFDVGLFDQVAAIVKPKRRRKLSPEQAEAAKHRLAAYRFSARPAVGEDTQL